MIFQCLHFVTETTLKNSRWWYSNVPILSLKRYYKTVTHKFQMSPFCRWSNIQNCRWWYSNVPILSLKRHYKTVADDIPMSPFCRWTKLQNRHSRYSNVPILLLKRQIFFEIQRQKVDFFNKKYQRHFWGCDEKKFQRQMCDCQNSLRTYVLKSIF